MKVFLSHPMNGLTEDMIKEVRAEMIQFADDIIEEKAEIINSYFESENAVKYSPSKNHSLDCLGASIRTLAEADMIIMGKGWEYARGCRIEHECAVQYGIHIVYM